MGAAGLRKAVLKRFSGEKGGRLAMGLVLALAVCLVLAAGITRLAMALEPDPAQRMQSEGPEGFLGMDEGALTGLLGQPQQREALGADLRLSYGGAVPFSLTLSGSSGLCTAVTVKGMALLGVEPGMDTAQARAVLSREGVHWLDNAFDPAYSGGGVRSPETGWIAAYSGGFLYEFCYDRDDPGQAITVVRVGEGGALEQPDNLFCAPQLAECLDGADPITLLGMTPEEARARWGFCGETLSLSAGYTDGEPGGLLSSELSARYGYGEGEVAYSSTGAFGYDQPGRYVMLVTQSAGLPVLGLIPGITTAQEAADILLIHGGVECTLAAPAVLERGETYAQLDPELLEARGTGDGRQVYLTEQWYVELRFEGGVLSRAAFCLLDRAPDLTPPEGQEEVGPDNPDSLPAHGKGQDGETDSQGEGQDAQTTQPPAQDDPANESYQSGGQSAPAQGGQDSGYQQPQGGAGQGGGASQSGRRAYTVAGVTFSLLLPEGWDQRCTSVQSADSLTLYDAATYQSQWGGALLTIRCFADGEDYTSQTAYRVLAQTQSGTLVAIYPTQVQYDTGDGAAAQRYQQLSDTLSGILDSLRLISG